MVKLYWFVKSVVAVQLTEVCASQLFRRVLCLVLCLFTSSLIVYLYVETRCGLVLAVSWFLIPHSPPLSVPFDKIVFPMISC